MSISNELITLNTTKQNIKTAINLKGVTVNDEPFADYPDKVRLIPNGGGIYESTIILYLENRLKNVDIPYGTTSIGNWAFRESRLEEVTIPSTVTTIGTSAFRDSMYLEEITIPSSVVSIGENAFEWCAKLTAINLPNTAITLGEYIFSNCWGLTSVTIPDAVTEIPQNAFYMNPNMGRTPHLETVVLGTGITSISYFAFAGNKALQSFTVKATVPPTLASNAFQSTNSRFTIYVPSQSVLAYQTADGWMNYASRITAIP